MDELPWTPDFNRYSDNPPIRQAIAHGEFVEVTWHDDKTSRFDVFLLRENSPDPQTVHPESREMLISPLDVPADLRAITATVEDNGALRIDWSTGEYSSYHPGWLREHAWFDDAENSTGVPPVVEPVCWDGRVLKQPPTFDGSATLADDRAFLSWLEALATYGIARLGDLPDEDGLLEKVVRKIGPPRESNFGPLYVLEIKDQPDSNAFTSGALLQHMDLPTRECPHGLQFLFCRRNSASGGEGVYVDGFQVADALRKVEPGIFNSLVTIPWVFTNRSTTSDYRAVGPVIELDAQGSVREIRLTPWLRAPLKAPLSVQQEAYRAIRVLTGYLQDARYQMVFRYRPGDLLAFDNRRILHGRRAYDAKSGERYIEGIYADRDELYSRIRTLRRDLG